MFNEGFTYPLPRKTVIRETESAEKAYFKWLSGETVSINGQAYRKGYNYKNATLIRWLDITPEEQRERLERDRRILEMHEQGMSHREIASTINISPQTVTNALRRVSNF